MDVVSLFTVAIAIILSIYGFFYVAKTPLGKRIEQDNKRMLYYVESVNELGALEGSFRNLRNIYIITDFVEKPIDKLKEAVNKNVVNGIKYHFFISKSNFNSKASFLDFFNDFLPGNLVSDSIQIHDLGFEWKKSKFIFYEMDDVPEDKDLQIIGFKGINRKDKMTVKYSLLDEVNAGSIITSLKDHNIDIPSVDNWQVYSAEKLQHIKLESLLENSITSLN